ncbi:MAG TPA: NAD(+)/NADH kinase [Thermoanaerobaculia bacterium]|nr:NAD(+)/NADH kinase [Thermoanaerobaculia bacterium]
MPNPSADGAPMSFQRVGIVAKAASREALRTAGELAEWLARREVEVLLDEATGRARGGREGSYSPQVAVDLVVVLGGDGTLLAVARSLSAPTPILGVNMGSLGFLTEVGRSELYPSMVRVLSGQFTTEDRALLEVELRRVGGQSLSFRVLNDAVIAKSALARIIQLTLTVDGQLVGHFRADGLIVSTPTGSTAYNLSAGGPILCPELPVAVITPICPHALSLRPLVVPDGSLVEVTLETQREEVYLTLDGQEGTSLGFQDRVQIRRGEGRVRLVKTSGRSFYESLRGKLRWGG